MAAGACNGKQAFIIYTILKRCSTSYIGKYGLNSNQKSRILQGGNFLLSRTFVRASVKDTEFVREQIKFKPGNEDQIEEMIKNVQKKTGVIVKLQKSEHGILIGGTRQEVEQAVLNIKSSMKQDGRDKSNLVAQDSEFERTGFTKEKPIWAYYRRNFKGQKPPMKTRKKCIRGKGNSQKVSGNPCPICRLYLAGEYKLDYKDVDLLAQFISPHTGEIFDSAKTGVCRHQQKNLIDVIQTAKDYGLLHYTIPGPRSIEKPIKHAKIPANVRLK